MVYYSGIIPLEIFEQSSPTTPSTSMTQNLISEMFDIGNAGSYAFQAVWTGSPTGTFSIVGSLDGINFNIPIYSILTGGVSGNVTYDLFGTSVGALKGVYTFTSGTGTLSMNGSKKIQSGMGTLQSV